MKNIKSLTIAAKKNTLYSTVEYVLFSAHPENRNGLQAARVAKFAKLIASGEFNPILGAIFVSSKGIIYEGTHRFAALQAAGMPIVFIIIDDISIDDVADFNSGHSSKWSPEDHLGSAVSGDSVVAIKILKLRNKLLSKHGLVSSKLSAGEMVGVLARNIKFFGGGQSAPKRKDYFSNELESLIALKQYKIDIDLYARLKALFKTNRDAYKIGKSVMKTYIEDDKFNFVHFIKNLESGNVEFSIKESKVNLIRKEVKRCHNYGLSKEDKIK